jgi:hypothetical protein
MPSSVIFPAGFAEDECFCEDESLKTDAFRTEDAATVTGASRAGHFNAFSS